MSGSGSTVIGYYSNQEAAQKSWQILKKKYATCFLTEIQENEGENYVG